MSALLEISDVEVRYGRLVALRGLSMEVRQGEVVCLIGPNGAGKSTTLAAVAGGVPRYAGSIRFDGQELPARKPEQIARLGLSLVPEGRHVFGTLTVEENLRVGGLSPAEIERSRRSAGAGRELFSAAEGALALARRASFRRRAADAVHRPRVDDGAAPGHGR